MDTAKTNGTAEHKQSQCLLVVPRLTKEMLDHQAFDSLMCDPSYRHAVHAMIWAESNKKVLSKYESKASILMQMRFDGHLGFPGGIVDENEPGLKKVSGFGLPESLQTISEAVIRELKEEVNFDDKKFTITPENYVFSDKEDSRRIYCHFFHLKVTMEEFEGIEKEAMGAADHGDEVMGHIRVPLYTMNDGYRGFPAFLNNQFIGCSKLQLLRSIINLKLMTFEELGKADMSANVVFEKYIVHNH